jgi:hypothetical protein
MEKKVVFLGYSLEEHIKIFLQQKQSEKAMGQHYWITNMSSILGCSNYPEVEQAKRFGDAFDKLEKIGVKPIVYRVDECERHIRVEALLAELARVQTDIDSKQSVKLFKVEDLV